MDSAQENSPFVGSCVNEVTNDSLTFRPNKKISFPRILSGPHEWTGKKNRKRHGEKTRRVRESERWNKESETKRIEGESEDSHTNRITGEAGWSSNQE